VYGSETHAFETLGMNRVELLTDYLNERSRRAILRLGAKEEGVLRNHMVMPNGRIRDSVLYSIIKNEWPGVKEHLSFKLSARLAQQTAAAARREDAAPAERQG
jgi:N-acetyltransferase